MVDGGCLRRPTLSDHRANGLAGPIVKQEGHFAAQGIMGGGFHDSGGQGTGHCRINGVAALPEDAHSGLGGQLSTAADHASSAPDHGPVGIFAVRAGGKRRRLGGHGCASISPDAVPYFWGRGAGD